MVTIIVPLAGASSYFEGPEYSFPKPFVEIGDRLMIEMVCENLEKIKGQKKFVFIIKAEDAKKFHLDRTLKLLIPSAQVVTLAKPTKGAACSVLMAIDQIDPKGEVIICNGDQIITADYNSILDHFRAEKVEGGVIGFKSVHPKWSYFRIENGEIIETSEKTPLSKNAIAGFYYFSTGQHCIDALFSSIEAGDDVGGLYYIAPSLNQLILKGKRVGYKTIENSQYHSFYSPQKIKEYERDFLKK